MGQFESVICNGILDEFAQKLLIKFKFSEEKVQIAIEEVKSFSRLVTISGRLKAVPNDPDDDMVIECAMTGKATHIVTGDKHLLSLLSYQGISIIGASEFLLLLSQM
jgi:putative PIN family toxin of toxin-antitoxin system